MKKIITTALFYLIFLSYTNANTAYTGIRDIGIMDYVKDMQVGWNLGNTLDANGDWVSGLNTETCWGNPKTTKAMIDEIAKMGFKTIRLPVTWRGHINNSSDYTIDSLWLNRVEEVANYAFQNNMYVIINSHHENPWIKLNVADSSNVKYQLNRLWSQIAKRFINYGDYLIFETLNEPRTEGSGSEWVGGTPTERSILKDYHKTCVDAIRATGGNNALRKIMISSYSASSNANAMNDLVIPNADTNIIVSIHDYYPYDFCLGGTRKTWGLNSDKASMDAELDRIYNKFVAKGIPVVLGEWCNIDNNNYADRLLHADYFTKACKKRNIIPIWWDANSDSRLLNRSTLEWVTPEIIRILVEGASHQACTQTKLTPYYKPGEKNSIQSSYITGAKEGSALKLIVQHESTGTAQWVNFSGDTIAGNELGFDPVKRTDAGWYKAILINSEGCKSWEYFKVGVDTTATNTEAPNLNNDIISNATIRITDKITIDFNINRACSVRMNLTDISGKTINEIDLGKKNTGFYSQTFDCNLKCGVYLINMQLDNQSKSYKVFVNNKN